MSTIASLMTWAACEAELKTALGISGSAEDGRLQLWLAAFAEQADSYVDGTSFTTLPTPVRLAVYSAVETFRARHRSSGLSSASTAQLSENYAEAFAADAAFKSARLFLDPYKTELWNRGK